MESPEELVVKSHFIWLDYIIDNYLEILENAKKRQKEKKIEQIKNLALDGLFLIRRERDLRFRAWVNSKICSVKEEINFKNQVLKVLGDYFQTPNKIKSIRNSEGLYLSTIIPINYSLNDYSIWVICLQTHPYNLNGYLNFRKKKFEEKKDEIGLEVIDILSHGINITFIQFLMKSHNLIEDIDNTNIDYYSLERFLNENIGYKGIYEVDLPIKQYEEIEQISDHIFSTFIFEQLIRIYKITKENLKLYFPLVTYTISTISMNWFKHLSVNEKIFILNKEYTKVNLSKLSGINWKKLKENSAFFDDVATKIKTFRKQGYINEGIDLANCILKMKFYTSTKDLYLLLRLQILNYLENEDLENIQKLVDEYNTLISYTSFQVLPLKFSFIVAFYNLKKEKNINLLIQNVESQLETIKSKKKFSLIEDLIDVYQQIGFFKRELIMMEKLRKLDKNLFQKSIHFNRYKDLQRPISLNTNKPHITGVDSNLQAEISNQLELSYMEYHKFNFEKTIKHCSKIIQKLNLIQASFPVSFSYNQELAVALFHRGRAYVYLKKYQLALNDFKLAIKLNSKDYNSMSIILFISILSESAIGDKIFNKIHNYNQVDCSKLTRYFIGNIIGLLYKNQLHDLIEFLRNFYVQAKKENYANTMFYLDIGDELTNFRIQDMALKYYNLGLNSAKLSNVQNAKYILGKGVVYTTQYNYKVAKCYYTRALEFNAPEISSDIYGSLGTLYGYLFEYKEACRNLKLCLDAMDAETLEGKEGNLRKCEYERYKKFSKEKILIKRIPQEYTDAILFIRTSEHIFQNFTKTYRDEILDASPTVTGYTKAIESILNLAVVQKYFKHVTYSFDENSFKERFSRSKNGKLKAVIIKSFNKVEHSLGLGSWIWIFKDKKDVLNQHFINFSNENYETSFIKKISSILKEKAFFNNDKTIVELRNHLSHIHGIIYQQVLEIRTNLIKTLNAVIELLFPLN